ncbi:MAG: hypothetical protein Q9227_008140 [Pyrenula ochraceoflavens]
MSTQKKSFFERQKAEAEAKKAKDDAETAAVRMRLVYEDFVKSFDDEAGPEKLHGNTGIRGGSGGFGGISAAPGKRHFTGLQSRNSGPGSLGPPSSAKSGPGSLGPAPSLGKRRTLEETDSYRRGGKHGMFAFEDGPRSGASLDAVSAFKREDDEEEDKAADSRAEERAAAKPTLHLSSLPPGTSTAVIKSLIPAVLSIDNVKFLPSTGHNSSSTTERKSSAAIVTLAKDTPATDIDTVVNSLQNRYLGWGFNLSISRHLSSAAISGGMPVTSSMASISSQPFGARPIPQAASMNRAPPPGQGRGFAPPPSYTSSGYSRFGSQPVQVNVQPPSDLKELKLIHKTLEALLTYGPEFEALLMSRSSVQKNPKWAWLWNSRSPGGVYYRWRLWEILTNSANRNRRRGNIYQRATPHQVFENNALWVSPERDLKFEYTTNICDVISEPDYDSSEEEEDERIGRRDYNDSGQGLSEAAPEASKDEKGYLSPLAKAKLTHLLARLPTTNAKLRKGDIARLTAFAIEHAGSGADEVVDVITSNVLRPFSYSPANLEADKNGQEDVDIDAMEDDDQAAAQGKFDMTPSSLIGLYVISDILSSSSTSGVRHAWRYRSLFELSLKKYQVFETLGRIDRTMGWGRLKAEKWKRSVQALLSLWEGWCVFPQDSQEHFAEVFMNPPLTEEEKQIAAQEEQRKARVEEDNKRARSKWKTVDEDDERNRMDFSLEANRDNEEGLDEIDGMAMEDDDVDEVIAGENLDGEPMLDSSDEGEPMVDDGREEDHRSQTHEVEPAVSGSAQLQKPQKRQRPTAMDMFGDSDHSG